MDEQKTCDCLCAVNHEGVGACTGRAAVPGLTVKAGKSGQTQVQVCRECYRETSRVKSERMAAQFAALPPDEQRVAALRLKAALLRTQATACDMEAAMVKTAGQMRLFVEAFNESVAQDVATHPDLAELNVLLDNMYDDASFSEDGQEGAR
ncbi:hypothetical protein [Streptomyces sp. NPDC058657]|uniref:hypothetical protein n=1 Tax=unclassified Streptomyces TaxID=2593676 RepID=UPI0036603D12